MKSTAAIVACMLSLAPASALSKESVKKPLNPVVHVCSNQDNSTHALACNIYKEARGESTNGQFAIGYVTINRSTHDKFPTSVRRVVYQPKQFSWTIHQKGYKIRDRAAWEQSLKISKFLMKLKDVPWLYVLLDNTNGSLYYHSVKVRPYWSPLFEKTVKIDGHQFYKTKES